MFRDILKFKFNNLITIVSLLFVFGGGIWAYFALQEVSDSIIIEYSSFVGINRVGYFWDLVKVGIFGIIAIGVNFLISVEIEKRDRFLGKLANAFTFFLSVLIFIYFVAIISVN